MVERIWIENVEPQVNGGTYSVKRTLGEQVVVQADILCDGHDMILAEVWYRSGKATRWRHVPMAHVSNDRWEGAFPIEKEEPYTFTVAASIDRYGSLRHLIEKKHAAKQQIMSELLEAQQLLGSIADKARSQDADWIKRHLGMLDDNREAAFLEFFLSEELRRVVNANPDRSQFVKYRSVLPVWVDRERARFGSWYEFFPRSTSTDPNRAGTFTDAIKALPRIAEMGFNVVYLPPVHPIGVSHRKGRNNALTAAPGDPGSPWAIGSVDGGHKSIAPELGTLDDFKRFVKEANNLGLETALDIAFQCSPDHPYVEEHPDWFYRRPDGSIHYAENPPKKYQDIYPLNFECEDWKNLWKELKSVFTFWIECGVTIFRVDNPHTKPFSFWEWVIAEVRKEHPEAIFLAEAFTRPKVMHALAKLGFSQSYTYFTWRNSKLELTEYLEELTTPPVSEFFRPNFFANTPDILTPYLQHGGRAAFCIRAVLAATMSSNYGIYSGYELCENEAHPDKEEYNFNEKYEIKHRDWNQPGNITPLITRLNELRNSREVLQYTNNLYFIPIDNPQMIAYLKEASRAEESLLVIVLLDPHGMQEATVDLPLERVGISDGTPYLVQDVLNGQMYEWFGRKNYVRLEPSGNCAHIFSFGN